MGREGGRGSGAGALKTTLHRPIFTLTTHRSSKTNQMVYLLPTDLIEEHIPFSAGKCLRNLLFLIQTSQFPLYGLQHIPALHSLHIFVCVNNLWAIPEDSTLGNLAEQAQPTVIPNPPSPRDTRASINAYKRRMEGWKELNRCQWSCGCLFIPAFCWR